MVYFTRNLLLKKGDMLLFAMFIKWLKIVFFMI